jgi:hypothetical protein
MVMMETHAFAIGLVDHLAAGRTSIEIFRRARPGPVSFLSFQKIGRNAWKANASNGIHRGNQGDRAYLPAGVGEEWRRSRLAASRAERDGTIGTPTAPCIGRNPIQLVPENKWERPRIERVSPSGVLWRAARAGRWMIPANEPIVSAQRSWRSCSCSCC